MTIAAALSASGIARAESEILLAHILGASRTSLLASPERELTAECQHHFQAFIDRCKKHEPIAFIIGEKEFYGRKFFVDQRALIPRPSTEVLIDETKKVCSLQYTSILRESWFTEADTDIVIFTQLFPHKLKAISYELLREQSNSGPAIVDVGCSSALRRAQDRWGHQSNSDLAIVDVGCGSGCIGITLALEIPEGHVLCTDVSEEALEIAQENAKRHNVLERVSFQKVSLLPNPNPNPNPFLVVSNPPYIPSGTKLPPDVSLYEPSEALFAGADGMDILHPLTRECRNHPLCRGYVLECRKEQAERLMELYG